MTQVLDLTESKRADERRQRMEIELRAAQKLESVGQLAAGVAHEINTPVQFVGDSIQFLKDAFDDLRGLVAHYRNCLSRAGLDDRLVAELAEAETAADLSYLEERVPGAFDRTLEGVSRVSSIVKAMRAFSHTQQSESAPADLNEALENTLTVAASEYRYVADVATDFGELPAVVCNVSDLNQVFLNLIVNGAHAIADRGASEAGRRGTLTISTRVEGDEVVIRVGDDGCGIPDEIRERIFDPFFTTKRIGRGSGQGLTIAHAIVSERHGGSLSFESELGVGTTFTIRLPLTEGQADAVERTRAAA